LTFFFEDEMIIKKGGCHEEGNRSDGFGGNVRMCRRRKKGSRGMRMERRLPLWMDKGWKYLRL
jgi:hypothetical protein